MMKLMFAALALLMTMLAANVAVAQTCDFSGAPVGPSEARMKVRVRGDDGVLRTHYFGGPAHAFYYIHDIYGETPNVHSAFVEDYAARKDSQDRMINAKDAWYLVDVDNAPSGTTARPATVGFATEADAQQWQERLGGQVVQGWDNVWEWLDEKYESSGGNLGDRQAHYERSEYY